MAAALLIRPPGRQLSAAGRGKPPPLRDLLFIPGLTTIMLVSVVTVVAQDLIGVYLPLLGAERGLTVDAVGMLLAVRAFSLDGCRGCCLRGCMPRSAAPR